MYYPPMVYPRTIMMTQPWVQGYVVADDNNVGAKQYAYLSVNNR